ncbi:MAG TPA: elongation factor P [bacterium]|nr:elongation factor P [bacterium]
MISTADFKNGMYIIFKDDINQIVEFQHVNPGKGSAFVRTRLKSLKSGKVVEFTFKSGEMVQEANVETSDAQYLFNDGKNYVFMDNNTFDQFEMPHDSLEYEGKYLTEGLQVLILKRNDIPLSIRLPRKMQLKVVSAPPGVKGDTATSASKSVTLENGLEVMTPLFVKEGDVIVINTDSGEYVERV